MVPKEWSWEGCSHDLVSPVAYLWRDREEGEEFLVLCDHVPVFGEEGLEMGKVQGVHSKIGLLFQPC